MKKSISRIIGLIMLIIAIVFESSRNEFSIEQYYYMVDVWCIFSCDSSVAYCT